VGCRPRARPILVLAVNHRPTGTSLRKSAIAWIFSSVIVVGCTAGLPDPHATIQSTTKRFYKRSLMRRSLAANALLIAL
jgi:hypothetical protein